MTGHDRELDCVGLYCPMPVAMTRKEIDGMEEGQVLRMAADDPAAEEDIRRWAENTGNELVDFAREDEVMVFYIRKKTGKGQ